ncbi:ABC transporter permease [Citricoccus sp. NR2]|uniref:ABC transporter permease n=1 Tax=Citricoccus sp. NR2 TaxID=3004095 RepID=UPI0022DD5B77|nr:ABC transporter permease [Citricoccus sp. NR2]WBL19035.1 ABC transporter permease [Citricoccus sp. NR2]
MTEQTRLSDAATLPTLAPAREHRVPSAWRSVWSYAEHFLRNLRRYGTVVVVEAVGEPLIYLMAMGLGLGSLIGGGEASIGGVDYVAFLAPALLAASILTSGSPEFTYPIMGGFSWHKTFYAAQATVLRPWHIAAGHILGVTIRFLVQATLFLVMMLPFGVVSSPWAWVQIFTATAGGLAIGLPLMAYAASLRRDAGQFAMVQRFIIMPMFLFSGTFYALNTLPLALQWIGWISPQWHAAQLGRILTYGMDNPAWLTGVHVAYLLALCAVGWIAVARVFERRLGGRDLVTVSRRELTKRSRVAQRNAQRDFSGPVPPMPSIEVRQGAFAGMYAGNIRAVMERGFRALKTNNWGIFISGFFEPVLYLLSLGLGLGALVGVVEGPAGPMEYGAFIAPALLAVSAMNGAIYDSTWNVFFKLRHAKLYRTMLTTSVGPLDVAMGEIGMALLRGGIYSTGFMLVMAVLGYLTSWWSLLLVPAALLVAFAFASLGMAITSYMRTFQQMDWIWVVMMPMFLFSATFFPLSVYPPVIQGIIQALPLWHAVELMRQLSVGAFSGVTFIHLGYFVVMITVGIWFTTHRLRALFLR